MPARHAPSARSLLTWPLLAWAVIAAGLMVTAPPAFAAGHWQTQAEGVSKAMDAAEAAFAKGDVDGAKRTVTEAYFRDFEDSKLEAAIRKYVGAKRAAEIEKSFATLRKAMGASDAAQVKAVAQSLREAVAVEAAKLDQSKVAPEVFEVNQ